MMIKDRRHVKSLTVEVLTCNLYKKELTKDGRGRIGRLEKCLTENKN